MKHAALLVLTILASLITPAHAGISIFGTPFPDSTFREFRGALERGDLEALCQITEREASARWCGELGLRELQELLGSMDLRIQSMTRHRAPRHYGPRHRIVDVAVIDGDHPEQGVAVILQNHCWGTGLGGRHCRISDVQWPSPAETLGRPY